MLIADCLRDPESALQYMERYVNMGSPSGFTREYRTSPLTDPWGDSPSFLLRACAAPPEWIREYGERSSALANLGLLNNEIALHPDVTETIRPAWVSNPKLVYRWIDGTQVVPTACARTVQLPGDQFSDYVKLHYPGILGRVRRELPWIKAISGPEICSELRQHYRERMPCTFAFLDEHLARVLVPPEETEGVGMVLRYGKPLSVARMQLVWPFFSLFSADTHRPADPPLLVQMLRRNSKQPHTYLMERIIAPVLECYGSLVTRFGFQPECNAQNLLLGLGADLEPTSVIFRDMGRVEKDLTIRSVLGLPNDFDSYPYKCISEADDVYTIRHSFAFDFKLSQYVLQPLEKVFSEAFPAHARSLHAAIRDQVRSFVAMTPKGYFPANGQWYSHDKILLTGKRPYVAHRDPPYR